MTVLLSIAVIPEDNSNPYVCMGSDSLSLTRGLDSSITRDEEYQKIFRFNNKLIGISGRVDAVFWQVLPGYIKDSEGGFGNFVEGLKTSLVTYMKNVEEYNEARCIIHIGCIENSSPYLATLDIRKKETENPVVNFFSIREGKTKGFASVPTGSVSEKDSDIFNEFNNQVQNNCVNFNLICVKKAMKNYLEKAAARYPDTCNQNIKIETLR